MLTAGQAGHQAPYRRLTVLAPRTRVDVALPADVPVAELVPLVLELVGEPIFGLRPAPWRLSGATGAPLPPAATLTELGVPDGELLRLAPDAPPPPPPVFDDPVDALAASAGGGGAQDRRPAAAAVLVVAAAAAALLAAGSGSAALRVVVATLAAGVAVVLAAHRPAGATARTAAVVAVPFAAAAGWAALSGASAPARVLLAAAAGCAAAAAAQVVLRVVAPALVAVVVAAVPVGLGALAALRFAAPLPTVAAAVGAFAVVVGPVLPRAALRLAGVGRPVVPADGAELVDADHGPDLLPPDELAERADLARGFLAGLVGGTSVVAAGAALGAASAGGWAGPALACVIVAVLGLRSRGFADPAPARALLGCAVAGLVGLAVLMGAEPTVRLVAVGVLLAVTTLGLLTLDRARPPASPVARRAVDLFDMLLIAATVPLALVAMDLFRLVRGL
jgi:type VII secretion integral membrane protein EccD